jgi:hypothetical protein
MDKAAKKAIKRAMKHHTQARRAELDAAMVTNAYQRDLERLRTAQAELRSQARWNETQPNWLTSRLQHQRLIVECKKKIARLEVCATRIFTTIDRRLLVLSRKTDRRQGIEEYLQEKFGEMRARGEELSEEQKEIESGFVGANTVEYTVRPRLAGRAGFFELDRALDVMSSVQDRLEGSSLFMYE